MLKVAFFSIPLSNSEYTHKMRMVGKMAPPWHSKPYQFVHFFIEEVCIKPLKCRALLSGSKCSVVNKTKSYLIKVQQ